MFFYKKFFWVALFLTMFFVGLSVRNIRPNISGDGLEYTLMTQAFMSHGAPNITQDDYRAVQSYAGDAGTNVPEVAARSSLSTSPPFFRDVSGRYYSYHFWLYSLFVVPLFFLVKLLGLATPWAFVATNLILALATSCAICAWRVVGRGQRLFLLTLYWSCGTIPYVSWTHPEVFSASLLVLSMMSVLSRRNVTAAIAAAMVAQQNPPAIFLVAIFLVIDFCSNVKRTGSVVPSIRKMMEWIGCISLSFASTIFYFVHFRVGNLITNSGFTKVELISFERLWSFYFDLNQGLVVVLWPLLLVVPIIVVCGIVRGKLKAAHYALALALVFASILLAVPSISATNFNSGASFVIRYAYWASIPLLFAMSILCVDGIWSGVLVYVGVVAFSIMNFSYYRGDWWSYLYYTPVAEWVMDKFPRMYNPVPEIFIERGLHIDGSMNDKVIYYYAAGGEVRKILLNGNFASLSDFKCADGNVGANYVDSTSRVEQGWIYFSLKSGCKAFYDVRGTYEVPLAVGAGDTLSFRRVGSGRLYLGSGWSKPEAWGTWSDASESSIVLPLKNGDVNELSFTANALVTAKHTKQVVDVIVNGTNAGSVSLNSSDKNEFDIHIPQEALWDMRRSEVLKLNFKFHDPISPKDLGMNGDDRTLSMGLISLAIK